MTSAGLKTQANLTVFHHFKLWRKEQNSSLTLKEVTCPAFVGRANG